jgi:hypothetical protein
MKAGELVHYLNLLVYYGIQKLNSITSRESYDPELELGSVMEEKYSMLLKSVADSFHINESENIDSVMLEMLKKMGKPISENDLIADKEQQNKEDLGGVIYSLFMDCRADSVLMRIVKGDDGELSVGILEVQKEGEEGSKNG